MREYAAIIVGGGASGLFCALRLAEAGVSDVLLLERNDRLGRKLSATGNGQGNVTNTDMSAEHYFTDAPATVASVLARFGEEDLLAALTALGGLFEADEVGRVYPTSRQAASVTDLLRFAVEGRIEVRLGARVRSARRGGGKFFVRTEGEEFCARSLVLACGGRAAPHFGTDGDGYALARAFGHTVTPLRPSLVQLKTEQTYIRGLKGVRADCAVRIVGSPVCMRGDLLFTDYGVSGDAVFRLSAFCEEGDMLSVDFLPAHPAEEIARILRAKAARYPHMRAEDLLRGIVNSSVGKCLAKYSANAEFFQFHPQNGGKSGKNGRDAAYGRPAGGVGADACARLAKCIKDFRLPVVGTLGFDYAQVTKGGVPLAEVDADLMSLRAGGLYLLGELLNVDGECGGYNLQWAFSCGAVAAAAIAGREYAHR